MAKKGTAKDPKIKLKQPDRSTPTNNTLLDLARQSGILDVAQKQEATDEEPLVGRVGDSILWSLSLTMLHFTLDVLVANQYAMEMEWTSLLIRTAQAFPSNLSHLLIVVQQLMINSNLPLLLLLPPSSRTAHPPPSIPTSNTDYHAPSIFLHLQRLCGVLFNTHHKRRQLLCCHEAVSSFGMYLDLVRD